MFDSDTQPGLLRCVFKLCWSCGKRGIKGGYAEFWFCILMIQDFLAFCGFFPAVLPLVLLSDQRSRGSNNKFWSGNNGPACTGCIMMYLHSVSLPAIVISQDQPSCSEMICIHPLHSFLKLVSWHRYHHPSPSSQGQAAQHSLHVFFLGVNLGWFSALCCHQRWLGGKSIVSLMNLTAN